jgi:hypothetical protein
MTQIVIQDILGSDNVGASRPIIQSNEKILCDAINKIETYLNTSPNGGDLNIANVLIKKYSQAVTSDILRVEASARIDGNLVIYKQLTVGTGIANEVSIFNSDLTVGRQFTVNRSQTNTNVTNFSNLNAGVSINDIFVLGGKYVHPVDTQVNIPILDVLGFVASSSPIILGKNNVNFSWNVTSLIGTPPETAKVRISDGYDGQVLFIHNSGVNPTGDALQVVHQPNIGGSENVIATFENVTTPTLLGKISMILMYDSTLAGWKVLSIVKPIGVTSTQYV